MPLIRQFGAYTFLANILDTIPAPLLDRMEVIEVSGYVSEEKSMIAERYLGPQAKEASGLKDADVVLDPSSVDVLIKYYCRESGVRNLKKHIDKIYRKASLKIVEDLGEDALPEAEAQPVSASATDDAVPVQDPPVDIPAAPETAAPHVSAETSSTEKKVTTEKRKPFKVPDSVHIRITPENLKDYVGPPVYHKDRMYVRPPPAGVSTGLGYLGNGSGAVMPIEATVSFLASRTVFYIHEHDCAVDNAGQGRFAADGQAGRSHPRERPNRAELDQGARARARRDRRPVGDDPERPRRACAHARGQHRQGGPERRHGAALRVRLAVHEDADQPGHCHDRRDLARGTGAARGRAQGEDLGGASRGHQDDSCAGGESRGH